MSPSQPAIGQVDLAAVCSSLVSKARDDEIELFVVGGAVFRDGSLLIVRRSTEDPCCPGQEEIPSGGVLDGEPLLDALRREIKEETGLEVLSVAGLLNTSDYTSIPSGRRVRQFNFAISVRPAAVVLSPREHGEFRWIPVGDLRSLLGTSITLPFRSLIEHLITIGPEEVCDGDVRKVTPTSRDR